jgi:hypothetical protein
MLMIGAHQRAVRFEATSGRPDGLMDSMIKWKNSSGVDSGTLLFLIWAFWLSEKNIWNSETAVCVAQSEHAPIFLEGPIPGNYLIECGNRPF